MKPASRYRLTAFRKMRRSAGGWRLRAGDRQRGIIGVLGVLLFSSAILVVGSAMVTTTIVNYNISAKRINSTQSYYNAESGAEDALMQIRRDPNYGLSPTTLTTTLGTNQSVTTQIDPSQEINCTSGRDVTAAGYVNSLVRRVRLSNCVSQTSVDAQFNFAVQVDTGGVNMSNNARVNGALYSNGSVQGANGATITAATTVAGVAPPDANPVFDPGSYWPFIFGWLGQIAGVDLAQSFIAPDNDKIIKASVKVRKFLNPTNATIRITTDSGNRPSTSTLASGTLLASSTGTNFGFVDVAMTTNPNLQAGTKYWLVIDASSNNFNFWAWASNNGYASGEGMYSTSWGGGQWTNANTDFAFKIWTGGTPTFLSSLAVGGVAKANTITGSAITGDAYYQTISGSTVGGTSFPGSTDPPAQSFPISDGNVADFKEQAEAGGTWNGDYEVSENTTVTFGPKKIVGNLRLQNNATMYLNGPLYVTGTVNLSNNAVVRLTNGFSSTDSTFILADGTIIISNNVQIIGNGASSFIMLITESTADPAMTVSNNSSNAILVTRKGRMLVSNNAGANALAAFSLQMSNNATITYVSGLAQVQFISGPGAKWTPQGWREIVQ